MSTFPTHARIHVMLGWVMAGMVVGAIVQTARVALAPQLFASTAKLTVLDHPPSERACWPDERFSFAKIVAETLQSPDMDSRARERMQALQPELKACEVETRVSPIAPDLFQVTAAGPEPIYTRQHLDALLDEFLAFRREMRGREEVGKGKPKLNHRTDEVVQERASPAVMEHRQWLKPLLMGAGAGMLGGFALFYLVSMGLALRALLAPS